MFTNPLRPIPCASALILSAALWAGDAPPDGDAASKEWPAWDGKETIAVYAARTGLAAQVTVIVGEEKSYPGPQAPEGWKPAPVTLTATLIPAGTFTMGTSTEDITKYLPSKSERGWYVAEIEGPPQQVTLKRPYYLGIHEVTHRQFVLTGIRACVSGAGVRSTDPDEGVKCVDYWGASEFARRLTELNQRTVRLPTEAEWEWACRAGTTTPWHTGESIDETKALFKAPDKEPSRVLTVGQFPPNAWGLYDMHGGSCEWAADITKRDQRLPAGPRIDPQCIPTPAEGGIWTQEKETELRMTKVHVYRGGSFMVAPWAGRVSSRYANIAATWHRDLGFRVVVDVASAQSGQTVPAPTPAH